MDPIPIYVHPTLGDDRNDGLLPQKSLKTLQAVSERIKMAVKSSTQDIVVYLAGILHIATLYGSNGTFHKCTHV